MLESECATVSSVSNLVLTDEFLRALDLLETGSNLFLTGKAGTGKSTLIRHFMEHTQRKVVVTAPTGIAALNVGGYTLHRLFSFGITTTLDDILTGAYRPGRFSRTLKGLDTLIVDEASMVRADLFDQLAAALRRFGPHPGQPFGGVQVVLVGDLFQLPPVVQEAEQVYFATEYSTPYFFSARDFHPEDFPTVALTHVFRQQGDQQLTDLLNAIREGTLLEEARTRLNSRTDPGFQPPEDEFWLTVTTTNRIATSHNRARLERLPGPDYRVSAHRTGDLSGFDPPVEDVLTFKEGAQVMMLSNDQADRWVNGSIGRILEVRTDGEQIAATVQFQDGTLADVTPHTWDATRPVVDGGALHHEVIGTFTQLPFKLAWAITIHKSQGQTLERMVVDLTGGTFAFGQLYVALSRGTSLDGMVLTRPVLPKDMKTDRRVLRFLTQATGGAAARGYCGLAALTVGEEGTRSRPRPIELAVALPDGRTLTTLVNPQRDIADARVRYGITAEDVLHAPTLPEAWAALAPHLTGLIPVAADADHTLGLIDFELKRLGVVTPLPLGLGLEGQSLTSVERAALASDSAPPRAEAALAARTRLGLTDPAATAFPAPDDDAPAGRLLTRKEAEAQRGRVAAARPLPDQVLRPGTRVCFTGTALAASSGSEVSRERMEALARQAGLTPVKNVSRTRCDALVVAEMGTQSRKAQAAREFGKPILLAADFLAWTQAERGH